MGDHSGDDHSDIAHGYHICIQLKKKNSKRVLINLDSRKEVYITYK